MRIIQLSDCHLLADETRVGYGNWCPYDTLQALLKQVKEQHADAILLTGDLSGDGSAQSYQHMADVLDEANLRAPLFMLAGNHDNKALMSARFAKPLEWLNQPIGGEHWHIHSLDTDFEGTCGTVSQASLERLVTNVSAAPDQWHAVAIHHHPIAVNGWMDRHELHNRNHVLHTLATLPRLKLVLYGHIHSDETHQRGHQTLLGCPSTCWQWQHSAEFAVSHERPGFRVVSVNDDGSIATHIERLAES